MNSYHPDAIVDGETGFLVGGPDEFAEKFDVLVEDSALRATMSKAAARHASRFDWDQVAAQWAQAFEKVAGENA
jgi:glycosyltransferase involved in cell wall biosynthesis